MYMWPISNPNETLDGAAEWGKKYILYNFLVYTLELYNHYQQFIVPNSQNYDKNDNNGRNPIYEIAIRRIKEAAWLPNVQEQINLQVSQRSYTVKLYLRIKHLFSLINSVILILSTV